MIAVTVLYPNRTGARFDLNYYCEKHIPMVQQRLGAICKRITVEHGVAGMTPGSAPAFRVVAHIYCDSAEAFQAAFAPHASAIMGDIPNYTDIEPTIQLSDVKI